MRLLIEQLQIVIRYVQIGTKLNEWIYIKKQNLIYFNTHIAFYLNILRLLKRTPVPRPL
jgi:hypothetical protein